VASSLSIPATAAATVISSPSSTQATPSAITILVWYGEHGSRSVRAGMRLRITGPGGNSDDVEDMLTSQAGPQRYPDLQVDTAIGSPTTPPRMETT
jgi:hypothetical protein